MAVVVALAAKVADVSERSIEAVLFNWRLVTLFAVFGGLFISTMLFASATRDVILTFPDIFVST